MLKIKRLDHVAICVPDIDAALPVYERLLGLHVVAREIVASQRTEAALLRIGETNLELVAPKGNEGLERFLERRGTGLHHIAVEVESIEGALAELARLGVPLIDSVPRIGARADRVAFVHPKATGGVLVELVESREHSGTES
jgi:methylmalonyl-CoA/ethylmalonyl-CoA epimerase